MTDKPGTIVLMDALSLSLVFAAVTANFNLPPKLLSAICYTESRHVATAVHRDDGGSNSVGLCQIKLATAKLLGFTGVEKDLMDPEINVYWSGMYLGRQLQRFHGDVPKAISAYNAGTPRYTAQGAFKNARYVEKVKSNWHHAP